MYPDNSLGVVAIVQQSITSLLLTNEPTFRLLGLRLFGIAAIVMISVHGLSWMYGPSHAEAKTWEFARALMRIAAGLTVITYYSAPIPGVGISFSNMVTDSTGYLSQLLDARAFEMALRQIDSLWAKFIWPNFTDIGALILYSILFIVMAASKAATIAVICFSLIASAICALVGPLFVWTMIVPQLSFLWHGWFRSFLTYSFVQVVASAYVVLGERLIEGMAGGFPENITSDLFPLYLANAGILLVTYTVGVLMIPSLCSSIFSGGASNSANAGLVTSAVRLGK